MRDYLYSSVPSGPSLVAALQDIQKDDDGTLREFSGDWGRVAVKQSHYRGFLPYENDHYLCVVVGAPVLYFSDNHFLTEEDSDTASRKIYERWILEGCMQWDEDLSGPFTVLLIDKLNKEIRTVSDLMSFIPVYCCRKEGELHLGTHVDALAKGCGEYDRLDAASLADFILNDVVTFPHTVYSALIQLKPGTETVWSVSGDVRREQAYWQPGELVGFSSLDEAALRLRSGVQRYIDAVVEGMPRLAQFFSAGEDSRALAGMLPRSVPRDAYVFVDSMNREAKLAQKASRYYGVHFTVGYRNKEHYLDILPEAAALTGLGHQYVHAHSFGFHKRYALADYPAVFGGFLSDTLLKSHYVNLVFRRDIYPFIPHWPVSPRSVVSNDSRCAALLRPDLLAIVMQRRQRHFAYVEGLRPQTAAEWFHFYPCSMHNDMPNLYATRRLFRSYEPFMCSDVVKVMASVPTAWKLNRRLFNRSMKPFLKESRWCRNAEGGFPYLPWWMNIPFQLISWFYWRVARRVGYVKNYQGPWADWRAVLSSQRWTALMRDLTVSGTQPVFRDGVDMVRLALSEDLTPSQKTSLVQVLYQLSLRASDTPTEGASGGKV